MAIQIGWDDTEQTILHCRFSAGWDWDDFARTVANTHRLIDTHPAQIDLILHLPTDDPLPPGNLLEHVGRALERMPSWHGRAVIVSNKPFLRKVVRLINQVYRRQFEVVADLPAARAVLRLTAKPPGPARCSSARDGL